MGKIRFPHLGIIGCPVTIQGDFGLEPGHQRVVKALAQVPVEALDLALGLCPVGSAKAHGEAKVARERQQPRVQPVRTAPIGVSLEHHGLHVVKEHLTRHAAKVAKGCLKTGLDREPGLVFDEAHEAHAAVAKGGHERRVATT